MLIFLLPVATTKGVNTNSQCIPCLFSSCCYVMGKALGKISSLS